MAAASAAAGSASLLPVARAVVGLCVAMRGAGGSGSVDERLASEASGEVRLLMIENGNHVANNRAYLYRNQTADWMAAKLA